MVRHWVLNQQSWSGTHGLPYYVSQHIPFVAESIQIEFPVTSN